MKDSHSLSTSTKEKYIYNVPVYEMFVIIRMQLLLPGFMDIHCYIDIVFFTNRIFFLISRNDLERQYLEMLQFNINVGSSVYAKYYFDLRALADANDLSFPLEPLSKDRALKLEVGYWSYKCFFGYMRRKASVLNKMLEGNVKILLKFIKKS